jgi:hypothetical protein
LGVLCLPVLVGCAGTRAKPPPSWSSLVIVPRWAEDRIEIGDEPEAGRTVIEVFSSTGFGGATIRTTAGAGAPVAERWPQPITVRLHLRGLESFTVSNRRTELSVSVLVRDEAATILRTVRYGNDGASRRVPKGDAYWADVRIYDAAGKQGQRMPVVNGRIEVDVPPALFDDQTTEVTLSWVDFHRY